MNEYLLRLLATIKQAPSKDSAILDEFNAAVVDPLTLSKTYNDIVLIRKIFHQLWGERWHCVILIDFF